MRVLIISNLFPPFFVGGYEIAAKDTADLLVDRGHECTVLTSDFVNAQPASDREAYPVHRTLQLHYSWEPLRVVGSPVAQVEAHNEGEVHRVLASVAPDVVYFWNVFGLGVSPLRAVRSAGLPATMHLMDVVLAGYDLTVANLRKKWRGESDYPLCRLGRYVRNKISSSQYIADHFTTMGAHASSVIHPFVEPAPSAGAKQRYELGLPIRAVYVGQIERHKGVDLLCEALRRINRETTWTVSLHIFGRSGTGLDTALKAEFGEMIRIVSGMPRLQILERLSTYDIGFFPSTFPEPFGVAQLELMYAGLPVISSGQGGSREALSPSNSLRFESGSVADLCAKTVQLIRDYPQIAERLGTQAARDVRERFNKQGYVTRVEAHLASIVRAPPGRGRA